MSNPIKIQPLTVLAALLATAPLAVMAQGDAPSAREIYDQMCAGCHGFRGDGGEGHRGGFSPHVGTLANKAYMDELPDDYLFLVIKKGGAYMGKIATMPAWEKKLSDDEIHGLVDHIRTFTAERR